MNNPTELTYKDLTSVYEYLNGKLFDNELPTCLITMQRKNKARGYFSSQRFSNMVDEAITDEIALNPSLFQNRKPIEILSTLAHEMTHLWQAHNGKPSRSGYHNKEWVIKMKSIGLMPTATGIIGGKETGQSVTHVIQDNGLFYNAMQEFLASNKVNLYCDTATPGEKAKKKSKSDSKTKYTCPACDMNAWAKPNSNLICGDCEEKMGIAE